MLSTWFDRLVTKARCKRARPSCGPYCLPRKRTIKACDKALLSCLPQKLLLEHPPTTTTNGSCTRTSVPCWVHCASNMQSNIISLNNIPQYMNIIIISDSQYSKATYRRKSKRKHSAWTMNINLNISKSLRLTAMMAQG
jgi:hypothetical protein